MLIFGIIVFFSYVFFVTCRFIIVETISAVKEEEKRNYNKIGKGLKMGGIGGGIK